MKVRIWPRNDGSVRDSGYPTMPVVKTTSPNFRVAAPKPIPSNRVPSSSNKVPPSSDGAGWDDTALGTQRFRGSGRHLTLASPGERPMVPAPPGAVNRAGAPRDACPGCPG